MIAVFVWVRTVAYSFYNKLLFDRREKSYLFFSLFSFISYLEKSRRDQRKVKSEK
jgi:hypothetical protein